MPTIWAASDRKARLRVLFVLACGALAGCSASSAIDPVQTTSIAQPVAATMPDGQGILSLAEDQAQEQDRIDREAVAAAIGTGSEGVPQRWLSPETGSTGMVTVLAERRDKTGRPCRIFEGLRSADTGITSMRGAACRTGSQWTLASYQEMQ